ncbi:MAG: DUF2905 domain-containing protein [Candidatus Omnitrophica bacterium]|nr:DUF2905 domain-containing protein [Candidatus Omnitrophota bacterium]
MLNFQIGKILIIMGIFIASVGIVFLLVDKVPFLGKLPGDIHIQKENFSFYFPLTTCILISIIVSLIFWMFSKK